MDRPNVESIEHYEMIAGALTIATEDGHAPLVIGSLVRWLRDVGITAAQIERRMVDVMGPELEASAEKRRQHVAWGRCGDGLPHPHQPKTLIYDAHDGDPCRRCGEKSPFGVNDDWPSSIDQPQSRES